MSTIEGVHVPVIALLEVVGKTGAVSPLQIAEVIEKAGVTFELTVIVFVTGEAHAPPPAGVKTYVPVLTLLTVDGVQVPVTALSEVVGKTGTVDPLQIETGNVNVGVVVFELTTTVIDAVEAHEPTVGVNTYVPVFALSTTDGDHVPLIELSEVVPKTGAVAPEQILDTIEKVGVIVDVETVMTLVVTAAHWPAVGVNV